jgi:hypothetical protein
MRSTLKMIVSILLIHALFACSSQEGKTEKSLLSETIVTESEEIDTEFNKEANIEVADVYTKIPLGGKYASSDGYTEIGNTKTNIRIWWIGDHGPEPKPIGRSIPEDGDYDVFVSMKGKDIGGGPLYYSPVKGVDMVGIYAKKGIINAVYLFSSNGTIIKEKTAH